jgi:hypothetical protein
MAEEVYGRPKTLKYFISSKMRGDVLVVERERAAVAVETIPRLAHAWYWERDTNAGTVLRRGDLPGRGGDLRRADPDTR